MSTLRCKFRPAPGKGRRSRPEAKPRVKGPSRAARMLALAYFVERDIEAGKIPDCATAARTLGVTRARMSQVMRLLLLAPELQRSVLEGRIRTERSLRAVVAEPNWEIQVSLKT